MQLVLPSQQKLKLLLLLLLLLLSITGQQLASVQQYHWTHPVQLLLSLLLPLLRQQLLKPDSHRLAASLQAQEDQA
jgi:hypothetical protein